MESTSITVEKQLELLRHFEQWKVFGAQSNTPLYLDSKLHLVLGTYGQSTLNQIWGPFEYFRDWHSLRHGAGRLLGRICRTRRKISASVEGVPNDAVVFRSIFGQTIVVASAREGIVVKLANHPHAQYDLRCAVESWHKFQEARQANLLPELVDHGVLSDGTTFIVSKFCRSRLPLFRTQKGKNWPRTASELVYPNLQRFHDSNGVSVISGAEWARLIRSKYSGRSMPAIMEACRDRILERITSHLEAKVLVGLISGDLQPQNVLLSRHSIKILDWSSLSTSILLVDVFCDIFYRAMSSPESESSRKFWEFATGSRSINDTPEVMQRTYTNWVHWLKDWKGIELDESEFRLQIQGMCWDWLGSMAHPWLADGSLWERIRFDRGFLDNAAS